MGVLLPYLSPSKKRRPPEPDNLPMLAMLVQIAARDHGIRPTAILRRLQEAMIRIRQEKDPKWHPMVSARSVAGRQHGKLTDGEYLKRSMEELLPEELRRLGVDPSKFKLSLDEPEN